MYGCSQSHGNFLGTLSIRPETMIRMISDIAEWLYRSNIRKILLLNGHMWNWGPIYSARENIHYDFPDLQVRVLDWWASTPQITAQSTKDCPVLPSYVHANIGETSCVLAVRPDLVNMTKAVNEKDYFSVNAAGTENLIQAVIEKNPKIKRFVYLDFVFF